MKKFWITILSVLMLVTNVAFVAACDSCGGDVLTNYVLSESGSLVEDDFILPLTVNDKKVEWKSNSDAIAIEQRTEDYLAKVNLGDEAQPVELTVTHGKESKMFEVTVAALDVHYFADKYVFKQNNATVYEPFDLDTSFTIGGKTATISWSVRESDKEYIGISADGKKCTIVGTPMEVDVRISAKFTYNDEEHTVPYRMKVSFKREHLEEVDYWYMNTDVSITMSGYVVAIATEYSSQFGNVSLYMVDDDFCAGYYIYRVKTDTESGNALEPGVHVTVTGTKNTNYNGLVETNAGGNLVVDKGIEKINVSEKVYALDNDLLAGAPAAIYNTSRIISLDKWAVKSVASAAPEAGKTATLFTLSKGGVDVTVAVSKYLEGAYKTKAGDATWEALAALQGTVKVGDVISVSGVLGNYNGYQLMPLSAADVKVETVVATDVPAMCGKVSAAISAVKTAIKTDITADTTLTVPTTADGGIEIKYELLHSSDAVTVGNGTITVKVGPENNASIKVTYTVKNGDSVAYQTVTFHNIHSKDPAAVPDSEKVSNALAAVDTSMTVNKVGETTLPESTVVGVVFTWGVKSGDAATIVEGKLKVTALPSADATVVITVTATCGDATDSKDVTVTVKGEVALNPGEQATANVNFAEYAAANGWENSKQYLDVNVDTHIGVSVTSTPANPQSPSTNSGKYYTSGNQWRIYENENPEIKFLAVEGYKIVSVKITYVGEKNGLLTNADKTVQYANDEVISVNGNTVSFSVNNGTEGKGQVRITAIEVIYEKI